MRGRPTNLPVPTGSVLAAVRWWAVALWGLIALAGCYRTPTAAPLNWSKMDVEQLRHEFDRMEWE